jgi:hypothetical protein
MFRQKPAFKDDYKISEIVSVEPEKCNSLFGLYKEDCIAISTKDGIIHYLEYSFKGVEDAQNVSDDIKTFINSTDKKTKDYKIIAEKDAENINTMIFGWGMIILFGLLISLGFVKGTTNKYEDMTYKEQFEAIKKSFTVENLKTLPERFVNWFKIRVLKKWFKVEFDEK